MSVPARRLPAPVAEPVRRTARPRPSTHPTPGARPVTRRATAPVPRTAARARRRAHAGFLVFAAIVVTALVVGIVSVNALVAQSSFHLREAQARVDDLRSAGVGLTDEAARLSSPVAVAAWARRHGMVTPAAGSVHILRVPGSGG